MDYAIRQTDNLGLISHYGSKPLDVRCNMDHCDKQIPDGIGIFLCERHLQKAWAAYQIVMGADVPTPRENKKIDVYANDTDGIVYCIRVGDLIKIGWSRNIRKRLADLGSDAVFFTRRGTRVDEYKLQAHFLDHLAKGREWFKYNDDTLKLVDAARLGKI